MAAQDAKKRATPAEEVQWCEQDKDKVQLLQNMAIRIFERRNTLKNAYPEPEEACDENDVGNRNDIKNAKLSNSCGASKPTPDR